MSTVLKGMRALPRRQPGDAPEASLSVSLLIPARRASHSLEETVARAHEFLSARFARDFEIILIPNPAPSNDDSIAIAEALARRFDGVRSVPHFGPDAPQGKGAALRTGVFASRGRWILFTDADLPYDLTFFDGAFRLLRQGAGLVSGNRRVDESHFDLPVELLPVAYGRHRLGLAFNRAVRLLLPVRTTDTQSGIKAMSRELALQAFSLQACPGFFFDLEIFLTAEGHGFWTAETPVTLYLNSEKSTVRVLRESVLAGFWLARLAWRYRRGAYRLPRLKIARRYPEVSLGTRVFLALRWALTPYSRMAAYLPRQGRILDLGCGHGLFSLAAASTSPGRRILGVDHDEDRLQKAEKAALGYANLEFRRGDALADSAGPRFDAISLIDVLHYFSEEEQERLFSRALSSLAPGGMFLFREVDHQGGLASRWNRLYEKIATVTGFTQSKRESNLHFRSPTGWVGLLEKAGYRDIRSFSCSHFLFADVLFLGRKPDAPTDGGAR